MSIRAVAVVGNPKPASRTADAAQRLAVALGAEEVELIDVVTLGAGLLRWGDEKVTAAVAKVRASDLAVVASPTFKATYSGILKLFLDQFATASGLEGVVAVPLMLGAAAGHQLAPELLLKPVLVELGATVPVQGLYQLDSTYLADPVAEQWVARWGPVIRRLTAG